MRNIRKTVNRGMEITLVRPIDQGIGVSARGKRLGFRRLSAGISHLFESNPASAARCVRVPPRLR